VLSENFPCLIFHPICSKLLTSDNSRFLGDAPDHWVVLTEAYLRIFGNERPTGETNTFSATKDTLQSYKVGDHIQAKLRPHPNCKG